MTRVAPHDLITILSRVPESSLLAIARWAERLRAFAEQADIDAAIPDALLNELDIARINTNLIPSADGGRFPDLDPLGWAAALEILGHGDPALTIALPGPGLAFPPIDALASPSQRAALFARFQSDRPVWGAFAISEPEAGSDATAIATTAQPDGDGYRLNGEKCFITNGARADVIVTFANLDPRRGRFGIRAFAVDQDNPGFSVVRTEPMYGLRASQLATLRFEDCWVPREAMLGGDGIRHRFLDAFSAAQSSWDFMRPLLACIMVGSARAALETVSETVSKYENATRLSADAMEHRLARLSREIASARALAYRAIWLTDRGLPATREAAVAKHAAAKAARSATEAGRELLTPKGWMAAPLLEKWRRDAIAFSIMEGTADIQVQNIVRLSIRRPELTEPVSRAPA